MFCLANKERSHYYVWANKERRQNRNVRLKRVGENFEQAWDQMSGGEHAVDRGRVEVAASGTVCTCTSATGETVFVVALVHREYTCTITLGDLRVGRICSVVV